MPMTPSVMRPDGAGLSARPSADAGTNSGAARIAPAAADCFSMSRRVRCLFNLRMNSSLRYLVMGCVWYFSDDRPGTWVSNLVAVGGQPLLLMAGKGTPSGCPESACRAQQCPETSTL